MRTADNTAEFQFAYPQGLVVDEEGFLYVVDRRRHTVDKFEYVAGPPETVRYVTSYGGFGAEPGKFILPFSVAADALQNRVFVTDLMNGRLQLLDRATGRVQDHWGRWSPMDPDCPAQGQGPGDFQLIQGVTTACGRPVVVSYGTELISFSWKGDLDNDGDVDSADSTLFIQCMQIMPPLPPESECNYADFDHDGDVDEADRAVFDQQVTGALSCSP